MGNRFLRTLCRDSVRPEWQVKELRFPQDQLLFSTTVNDLLAQLHTSHTSYLSPQDPEYYHLAAVFSFRPAIQALFDGQDIQYPTVGLLTERIEGRDFVVSVLPGGMWLRRRGCSREMKLSPLVVCRIIRLIRWRDLRWA